MTDPKLLEELQALLAAAKHAPRPWMVNPIEYRPSSLRMTYGTVEIADADNGTVACSPPCSSEELHNYYLQLFTLIVQAVNALPDLISDAEKLETINSNAADRRFD